MVSRAICTPTIIVAFACRSILRMTVVNVQIATLLRI